MYTLGQFMLMYGKSHHNIVNNYPPIKTNKIFKKQLEEIHKQYPHVTGRNEQPTSQNIQNSTATSLLILEFVFISAKYTVEKYTGNSSQPCGQCDTAKMGSFKTISSILIVELLVQQYLDMPYSKGI